MAIGGSLDIGSDDFMTLFVTQLQHQNPLEPTDNSEFMSQLAQFSTLEQTQRQTEYLADLDALNTAGLQLEQLSLANSFVGKTITYSDDDGDTTYTGVVDGVKLETDGSVSFLVGGKSVPFANFLEVLNSGSTGNTNDTTEDIEETEGTEDTDTKTD